jgi:hypothetical protein
VTIGAPKTKPMKIDGLKSGWRSFEIPLPDPNHLAFRRCQQPHQVGRDGRSSFILHSMAASERDHARPASGGFFLSNPPVLTRLLQSSPGREEACDSPAPTFAAN